MINSLYDVNAIALRLVFRRLNHQGKVQVMPEFKVTDQEKALSDAQFISRAKHSVLREMIEKQGAVAAALSAANGVPEQAQAEVPPENTTEAAEEMKAAVEEYIKDEPTPYIPTTGPVVEAPKSQPSVQSATGAVADANAGMAALAAAISPYLKVGMDKTEIAEMVRQTVKNVIDGSDPKVLEIRTPAGVTQIDDLRHKNFEKLLILSGARIHSMLVGPAGTGKSHAAKQVAKALGLGFRAESVGPQTTQAALLGYKDAHGNTVRTHFRECYEHGGVYCLDEVDAGSAAVLTVLNSALANGLCAFPDAMVERHPDFILIATSNTWGNGRDLKYVGRNALDAAFLNRFARLPWAEDEKLEKAFVKVGVWVKYVQAVRKLFREKSIQAVISPRTSELGSRALEAGMSVADVIECFIRCGLSEEANKVLDTVYLPTVETKTVG